MRRQVLSVELKYEHDVVLARQRARQVAALVGFDAQDQTRVATSVSEIARNAFRYAGGGRVEFSIDEQAPGGPMLMVRVTDNGRGIADLAAVLEGRYVSDTGMGVGLIGTRRLSDQFEIQSGASGTTVVFGRRIPRGAPPITAARLGAIASELAQRPPQSPAEELQQQNQELLRTLEALRNRQAQVERLNEELAETNRGVLALYAELDDKADDLRKASELKTKFLSHMTHELRTPLNSIIMLSRMMLKQDDAPLHAEHERQATFIRNAAEGLLELVNDLLDLAKIEAGKADVVAADFSVGELFGTLRGMFRPLLGAKEVELAFDLPDPPPVLHTDEAKVAQVLRNLLSNAVKFTERGEIRVSARVEPSGGPVVFTVADTGIGISADEQRRLFQEFSQVTGKYHAGVKGSGLGLSISRRLAELLGGRIDIESEPGVGSTFRVTLPVRYEGGGTTPEAVTAGAAQ